MEVTVLETTAAATETVQRLCRTILRIKARIVRAAPGLRTGAEHTALSLGPRAGGREPDTLIGPEQTALFDALLQSQLAYQQRGKADPSWLKTR